MTVYRKAEKTALIGLGCGKSAHTLLHDPTVGRLDVIEIEPAIVEASKLFGDRVKNVHTDPRCHIYVEDAKTFFSSRNEQYDLIISQPSNPWVSGVASLFTSEFYAHITRYLAEDGIFAQWMQIYEVDATLLATVVKALAPNFSDYNLYLTVDGDLLILATRHGRISYNGRDLFDIPDMNAELSRLGILNMQDILIRKVSSKSLIEPYFLSFDIAANSDYEPVLDLNAVKARFLQYKTPELLLSRVSLIPMLPFLDPNPPFPQPDFHQQLEISSLNYNAHQGLAILQKFQEMIFEEYKAGYAPDELSATVMNGVLAIYGECDSAFLANIWPVHFRNLMYLTLPYFGPQEMELIWAVIESANCYSQLPEYNRALVQLFKRLARRDVEGVLTDENFQLPEDWILPSERNDHLLALHMLGWLAADSPGNSLELWRRYGGKDSTTLELNMLHQMSLRRQEAEQAFEEGNEQFEKEEWQAAIKDYDRTIFLHPGHWRAYNNRGACQYKLGNKAAAIDDYSFAAMTNPGSGMIWLNLGKVKLETGNIEGACGDLTRALQLGQKEAEKDLVEHCQLPAAPSPAP
jgi:tetratricopeptide (TPR) repeat protein